MFTIKRIVCPVDLSEFSRHALGHARALAQWYEAEISVVHVFTVPLPLTPGPGTAEAYPPLPLPQPEEIAEEVRRFCRLGDARQGARVDVTVMEGKPATEIVRHAETLPADLLVMGTHGRGGFERLFLGSVTEKVLRSTHVPVLIVPPPVERVETVVYKTILCPTEFSDLSTRALEYALALAEETHARLILLHVIEGFVDDPRLISEASHFSVPEYYAHLEKEARARLKSALPEEARPWCHPEERVVFGKAYRVILQVAEELSADLIVMGVHGKSALNRRLFGSTTHHVIREARCPVLTLRG
jgi:nucleotide-binding universal stress UspA family protein